MRFSRCLSAVSQSGVVQCGVEMGRHGAAGRTSLRLMHVEVRVLAALPPVSQSSVAGLPVSQSNRPDSHPLSLPFGAVGWVRRGVG